MKRMMIIATTVLCFCLLCFAYSSAHAASYDSSSAVSYARQYALNYNSAYTSYKGRGGDCANFVSQCIYAGGIPTDNTWKPYTGAWLGANNLRVYLSQTLKYESHSKGDISLYNISPGDLFWEVGSDGTGYGHVTIVTSVSSSGVTICGHTNDRKDTTYSANYISNNVVFHVKMSQRRRIEDPDYASLVPLTGIKAKITGKVTVYDYNGNAFPLDVHYIDGASDICTIHHVYTDGFCEITYPTDSVPQTWLARRSDFNLPAISNPEWVTISANKTIIGIGETVQFGINSNVYQGYNGSYFDMYVWDSDAYAQGLAGTWFGVSGTEASYTFNTPGDYYVRGRVHNTASDIYSDPLIVHVAKRGSEMTSGFARTLPDGDYIIASIVKSDSAQVYFLDILGMDVPSASGDNVVICGPCDADAVPECDIWTLTYQSDGFYSIRQKGTDMYLDVLGDGKTECNNVAAWVDNGGGPVQRWAISYNGASNGYRLQCRYSSFCLDIANGNIANGNNVWQWESNDTTAQSWVFIPYMPTQPIADGRYMLISGMSDHLEMDVPGDTGDVPENVAVQVWSDQAPPEYNAFDFIKLPNGYYHIRHAASGKYLTVVSGSTIYSRPVTLMSSDGSISQQWAVLWGKDGMYSIIARCNGYAIDIKNSGKTDGTPVLSYPYHGGANQLWKVIPAEYIIAYDANNGKGAPEVQKKIFRNNLALSNVVPTLAGKRFMGWSVSPNAKVADYQPGDDYTADADITLYAVWAGPDFILPAALTEVGEEAFAGAAFTFAAVPEATAQINARAFANCPNLKYILIPNDETVIAKDAFEGVANLTIFGRDGSYAQYFANKYGYTFIQY